MSEIPFLDLKSLHQSIGPELSEALGRVLAHGQFINGPEVKQFEYKWADYCGSDFAVGASNGTAALHAILECLGIGRGDEVILPSHTFIATAESVRMTGARPVFAEINPQTMLIDPRAVSALITSKTRAIIPVHLYGMPCDMDPLNEIACRHNLPCIEDAAQGHGGRYKGRRVGNLGLAAAFSFFPGKNLGAFGDAGGITTMDAKLGERIRLYVNHGRESKYEHLIMGTNYRLDTIQATILLAKLRHLDAWNARRAAVAATYRERLSGDPFKSFGIRLQADTPGAQSAWHLFVIRTPMRERIAAELQKRGVATGIHYPIPCHLQPSMKDISPGEGSLLQTERAATQILSLPICPTMTPATAHQVCDILTIVLNDLRPSDP